MSSQCLLGVIKENHDHSRPGGQRLEP